ncbi:unnamed protein product [Scytosiphon promiscuus]
MSQQNQQLSGAVAILALSIATLAAVLASIERGRLRRDARDHCCHPCAPALAAGADASATRSPARASAAEQSAAGSGAGAEGGEERSLVVGPRTQPGSADDGRAPDPPGLPGRRLEILVHNISHKDMVLSLRRTRSAVKPARPQQRPTGEAVSDVIDAVDTALARPKFSLFKRSSELILKKLLDIRAARGSEPPPAICPVHRRGEPELWSDTPAPPRESDSTLEELQVNTVKSVKAACYENGVEFVKGCVRLRWSSSAGGKRADLAGMNRRDSSGLFMMEGESGGGRGVGSGQPGAGPKEDVGGSEELQDGEAYITGVYFPLLSVLMPKWLEQLDGNGEGADASQKTILLVSGVGQPRNEEHRLEDNSTEVTAVLMEAFLRRHFPDVRVVRVHSDTNIFRYDDNIRFVKTELLPLLNAERSRMAEKHGGDWQDMMHITMSFADGSPARISSINTALRHFRPSFIHIWELKTFWHEKIICEDDVEVHTFEDIDMQPPIPASEVDAPTGMVIAEMLRLRDDLERIVAAPARGGVVGGDTRDDLASFWLRKTKRPVLAVLLVQKKGGPPLLYRGTNMEVSMPTGSLCAERNVIGSALTADLSLLRRDIKAVAVLSVARRAPAGAEEGGDGRVGGAGGAAEDEKRLEGVRQVGRCAAFGGAHVYGSGVRSCLCGRIVAVHRPLRGVQVGTAWVRKLRAGPLNKIRSCCFSVVTSDSSLPSIPTSSCRSGGQPSRSQAETPLNSLRPDFSACASKALFARQRRRVQEYLRFASPTRADARLRSESCTDELLAAGRARTAEAFGSSPGVDGVVGEGPSVPRSQSLDLGAAEGGRGSRRDSSLAQEEDLSRRKILRGTKVVRSITSTPKRVGGSGSIISGADVVVSGERKGSANQDVGAGEGDDRGIYGEGARSDSKSGGGRGKAKKSRKNRSSVVAHVPAEALCSNPLKPCGACMEWLKKIAEVNPDFKVITFTDSRCGGVYIEDVAQIL